MIRKYNGKKKFIKYRNFNNILPKEVRYIDYKNVELLKKFINNHGRILHSQVTRVSALQQRNIAKAIKRARFMALLPYTKERIRK